MNQNNCTCKPTTFFNKIPEMDCQILKCTKCVGLVGWIGVKKEKKNVCCKWLSD